MDKSQELFEEAIKAVKECYWRQDLAGVSICPGVFLPCQVAINSGRCNTLTRLLKMKSESKEEKE